MSCDDVAPDFGERGQRRLSPVGGSHEQGRVDGSAMSLGFEFSAGLDLGCGCIVERLDPPLCPGVDINHDSVILVVFGCYASHGASDREYLVWPPGRGGRDLGDSDLGLGWRLRH